MAIPHSLSKNAKHSFISVVISEKGILWDNHLVHMIALLNVNDESRKIFAEVFDELVDILSDTSNATTLFHVKNYSQFISYIMQMMDRKRN